MIIRDTPSDLENFVSAEGETAFKLQQKGFVPMYMDDSVLYFKKNKKILKALQKLDSEL